MFQDMVGYDEEHLTQHIITPLIAKALRQKKQQKKRYDISTEKVRSYKTYFTVIQ